MKLLGPDDEEFILKDEEKADENEAIITEHIGLLSQEDELLGDTLMRMLIHIDVVRHNFFFESSLEADERTDRIAHNAIMDALNDVTQELRQAAEEIAKNYAEDEAVKVKQEMEVALMNFEKNTKGALARHDKAIDRLYEKRYRNERKGKGAS